MIDLRALTKELIDIPSITGEEAAIAEIVEYHLQKMGLTVVRQHVGEKRWNVFASFTEHPTLLFTTHLDTVPPFVPFQERDGFIFGRGACDAKGIVACMMKAVEDLSESGYRQASLLFVVGEELDSIGARHAAERLSGFEYVINGEPTMNQLISGQKGSLIIKLRARGVSAHSGYPELGSSAIETLIDVLNDIIAENWGDDSLLGNATVNIGTMNGGTAPNVIPDVATAELFFRIVDPVEVVIKHLLALVSDRIETEIISGSDPQTLHIVSGFKTAVARFGSDVQYLRKLGTPLMLGPGSIRDAHTSQEKISIEEMQLAVELYKKLYHVLLAG